MSQRATIALCLLVSGAFAYFVPFEHLFDTFPQIVTAMSIMAGAILVRLNRTMPTIDWKILDRAARQKLTQAVVDLAEEYLWFLAVSAILVGSLLTFMVIGRDEIFGSAKGSANVARAWFWYWRKLDAGFVGFGLTLVVIRMAYLVWRDVDIVRLQKHVIDLGAAEAHQVEQEKLAGEKRNSMGKANLHSISNPPPKAWGD